jgi:hypothetical protein
MSEGQRNALEDARVLLAAGDAHAWAAGVILEKCGGAIGRPIALALRQGRIRAAREELAEALAGVAA